MQAPLTNKLMKNCRTLLPAALLLLAALPSCDKDRPDAPNTHNPPVLELPGAPFELSALDHEQGYHRDSVYIFEGVWREPHFYFGRERLDTMQLNITPDNAIILQVRSDDPAFAGVNASSSARCIDIEPDGGDRSRYRLKWNAEGSSVITLWNGEGAARREVRFTATSRREIPLEGILVRIDGQERILGTEVKFGGQITFSASGDPLLYAQYYWDLRGFTREDRSHHACFEVAGPVPLNANSGKLHISLDEIGLVDHGAYYEALTPHIWLKAYGLYEENRQFNPDFRWFHPFIIEKVPEGQWRYDILNICPLYFRDDAYTLNPQDLRERFAWVWPQAYGTSFVFSVAEGDNISEQYNLWYYDRVHQIRLNFPNTARIPWEQYY